MKNLITHCIPLFRMNYQDKIQLNAKIAHKETTQ